MLDLDELELEVVKNVLTFNKDAFPYLESHLYNIKVLSRENIGVGRYTNFVYINPINSMNLDVMLSSKTRLKINTLVLDVSYVLNITNGKIDFLEIVTNGDEPWNSQIDLL